MRIGRILFAAALLICLFEMVRLWNISPDEMAVHFNVQGMPDRFVPKAEFFLSQVQTLFIMVLVSLPLQVIFLFVPPSIINMPNREYWLAPERKEETVGRLSDFGSMLFAFVLLDILAAFEIAAYANLRTPVYFNAGLMGGVMAVSMGFIVFIVIRLLISFRLPE